MNSGLYQINIGDYFYFGQTQDFKQRKSKHLWHLKKGTHRNKFMQNVYDKHQDFHFQEVLHCSVDELNQQEQRLLDAFWGTEGCLNISKDAEAVQRGLKRSEETKKKLSEAMKGVHEGEKHPSYNHTKYTFIHEEHGEITCTQYELYTKYNLQQGHVSKLISGKYKSTKGWRLKDPF